MTKENVAAGEGIPRLALSVCPPTTRGRGLLTGWAACDSPRPGRVTHASALGESQTANREGKSDTLKSPEMPCGFKNRHSVASVVSGVCLLCKRFRLNDKGTTLCLLRCKESEYYILLKEQQK